MTVLLVSAVDSVTFAVYVTPRAGRSEISGECGDALWVRLAALPVDGKANAALVALLAARLGVPKADVEIVAAATGRRKGVRVRGLEARAVRKRLALT